MFADAQATHLNVEAGAGEVKIEDVRSPFTSNRTDSRRRLAIVSMVALCLFGSVVAFIASHGSAAEVGQQAHKNRDAAFIAVPGGKRIASEGVQMDAGAGYGGGRVQGRGESREEKELRTQPAPGVDEEGNFMDALRQQLENEAAEVGDDDTDGNAAPAYWQKSNEICCASRSKFERRSNMPSLMCSNIPADCCWGRQEQGMTSKNVIPCLQKKHKDYIDNHQKTYGFLIGRPNLRWRVLSKDRIAKKNVQYL
jgi:hypothetical protein